MPVRSNAPLLPLCGLLLCSGAAATSPPPRLQRAARPYDVRHYRLLVRLDPRTGSYQMSTTVTFQVTAPMSVLELDAVGLHATGAWLLSRPGDPEGGQATALPVVVRENRQDEVQGTLVVTLPVRLLPGTEATVEIGTSATARREMSGLFTVTDPDHPKRPPLFLTHFEPLGARRFFPCHDDPADKATFDVTVETEARLQVLSNGRRVEDIPLPGAPPRHRVRYAMTRPIPPYLLGLAVGAFEQETIDDGGVPLDAYLHRGPKGAAAFALGTARDALQSFQRFLDMPYPFERYGQLEAPLFPVSAMENASLSFLSRSAMVLPAPDSQFGRLRVSAVVAHELAHQWFGNLVTMNWWDDVWLNESLATYLGGRFLRERFGAEAMDVRTLGELHEGYHRTDAGPRSHPVVNRDLQSLEDAFDAIIYSKGAQVMRMIEDLLGEERMAAGLGLFLRQHAFRNASGGDLLAALTWAQQHLPPPARRELGPAPDTPVAEFARSWLERRGHPVLTATWRYDAAQKKTVLTVRQRPSHTGDDTRWHVRLPVALRRRAPQRFDVEARVVIDRPEVTLSVPTPAPPEWVAWNRGGLALVTLESPGTSEETWALVAQSDPDPAVRLQALLMLLRPSLGDLSRLGEEALARALGSDPSAQLRYQIGRRLGRLRGQLREPLARAVVQAAQGPTGVDPADPLAVLLARAGAVELLGKVPGVEAARLLIELAQGPTTPIDLLGPAAEGLARRGDDMALAALEQAARVQAPRGFAYLSRVLGAYGAVGHPRLLREVVRVVRDNADRPGVVADVLRGLCHNEELRTSPELPQAVADLILGSPQLDENQQAQALEAMEGLRTREARAVLEMVRQRARAARIRILANLMLSRTFG